MGDHVAESAKDVAVGAPSASLDAERPDVIAFDFRHPPRIGRNRRANLETIFSRYALSVQAFLSSRLRGPADAVLNSVEQATFAEFVFSLSSPCAAIVFDLHKDGHQQGVLDFGTDLAFFLVDRLFGGPGDTPNLKRPMTQLERTVIRGVGDRLLSLFVDAWKEELAFDPQYVGFESTPDALSVTERDDNVLVANIEVRSGRFTGLISLCVSLHALESFLQDKPRRATRAHVVPESERASARRVLEQSVRAARLEAVARFPVFKLRARELAALRPGQVIHTGHHLEVPIELLISGQRRFTGILGEMHRNLGMRIAAVSPPTALGSGPSAPRGKVL
jgi:flagellar motor switch protein FliM